MKHISGRVVKNDNRKNNSVIKVLNLVWVMNTGGIESLVVNLYKNMNRDRVIMDFVVDVDSSDIYDDILNSLNAKKIAIFNEQEFKDKRFYQFRKLWRLYKILKKGNYDVIYNNLSYPSTLMYGAVAKIAKIPRIVSHAHSDTPKTIGKMSKKINEIQRTLFSWISDCNIAVSDDAGKWIYGRRVYQVIPNGIDYDRFSFSETSRKEIRSLLEIDEKQVVFGHIGRLTPQKNQFFLLKIFRRIHEKNPDTKLIIIGEGENERKLRDFAKEAGLSDDILFIGFTDNVERYLSAFDIFLFPSIWEGFGIAAVEAQASGIVTFISDAVPDNTHISDKVRKLPLDEDVWVKNCLETISSGDFKSHKATVNKGLDIHAIADRIQRLIVDEANDI